MLSDQVLRLLAGLLIGIWVARYLGPSSYGVFNYVVALVAILGTLAKLGLDSLVVKQVVMRPEMEDKVLGTAFWLKIFGAVVSVVMVAVYIALGFEEPSTSLFMMILSAGLLFQSVEVIEFYFQAKVRSRMVTISKTVQLIVSSALKVYLVIVKAELLYFVVVQLVDQATLAICQYLVFKVDEPKSNFISRFSGTIARELLSKSWPLIFGNIAIMVYMRIDQIMIMKFLGEREMGLFSAAVRLSEAWYFIPMVITNSLFPAILNARASDFEQYKVRLVRLFRFMFMVSIAVALPMTFMAPWLMWLLFGDAFVPGAPVLALHVWTGLFAALGVASSGWFISENMLKFALVKTVVGACMNILLNFALIPKFGMMGAAVSTIICQASVSIFFNAFHRRAREVFVLQLKGIGLGRLLKTHTR